MNDNEFNARVEGNKIVANVIRGYQRQLREAQAQLDTARAALEEAVWDWDAERAARRNVEEVNTDLLAACEALGAFTRELLQLVTTEQIIDAKLQRRMLKVNDQAFNALAKARGHEL